MLINNINEAVLGVARPKRPRGSYLHLRDPGKPPRLPERLQQGVLRVQDDGEEEDGEVASDVDREEPLERGEPDAAAAHRGPAHEGPEAGGEGDLQLEGHGRLHRGHA